MSEWLHGNQKIENSVWKCFCLFKTIINDHEQNIQLKCSKSKNASLMTDILRFLPFYTSCEVHALRIEILFPKSY